jgi:hypothetical protein
MIATPINQYDDGGAGLMYVRSATYNDEKRVHRCCGGCCDFRRAVIIVNVIGLVFNGLMFIAALAGLSLGNSATNGANSTANDDIFAGSDAKMFFGILVVVTVLCMASQVLGICGAVDFNVYMVGVCFVSYVLMFVVSVVFCSIQGMLINGFFAYPHFFFIKQVRDGILSDLTYPMQKQSCCCV